MKGGVFLDLGVQGKTYLVMGASRGLGQAVAQSLSAEGARVLGTSRKPGLDRVLDTGVPESRRAFLESVGEEQFHGIFVNTGGPPNGDVLELDDEVWIQAFQQVLLGPIHMVRSLVPQMPSGGSILFNASSSIRQPIPHLALSNVLRAGIHALVKSLVDELSSLGIRVNLIVPGRLDTGRVRKLDENTAARIGVTPEHVRQQSEDRIPLGRYGEPAEFGRLAAFLLSPAASYLNGGAYWVDGGQTRSL